jgi:hypothetical protein
MIFLLKCHCSEGIDDCDLAVVTITEVRKAQLLECRELFKMAKLHAAELATIRFWDSAPEYFAEYGSVVRQGDNGSDKYLLTPEEEGLYNDAAHLLISDEREKVLFEGATKAHTECDQLVINEDGFHWRNISKHTDGWCETCSLPWEVLLPQEGGTGQTEPGEEPR